MKKREATEEAQANTIGKIINNNNRAKTVCQTIGEEKKNVFVKKKKLILLLEIIKNMI